MAELFGSSYQEILKFLECPVCIETVYPPIFQCTNGHIICSRCKDGVRKICPICKVGLGDMRPTVFERFLPLLKLPCTYYTAGCDEIVAYEAKLKHEKSCKYRPYICPYVPSSSSSSPPQCKTEGDIPMLLTHLQSSHNFVFHNQSEFRLQIPFPDGASTVGYKCFDQHFFIHFEGFTSEDIYMAYLTIMGDEDLAKKFRYSLTIEEEDTKVNWEGCPRSIRESREDIWRNKKALLIHERSRILSLLSYHDHVMVGKIWMLKHGLSNPIRLIGEDARANGSGEKRANGSRRRSGVVERNTYKVEEVFDCRESGLLVFDSKIFVNK